MMKDLGVGSEVRFIDLFAGCGGLSLGLMTAGWTGLFGVECQADAFRTLVHNLDGDNPRSPVRYQWPTWLEKKPWFVSELISKHQSELLALRGQVGAIVGGPPCQGFSTAGRRE